MVTQLQAPINAALEVDGGAVDHTAVTVEANKGLRIVFKDLDYSVPSNVNRKERAFLLKKVSGWFEPHQMAALMGPSGSGKTTLLDLLAGRKTEGKTEGTLHFGGQTASKQFLRRYTGYVEQFDTLIGILTVEEMLMYTAELKRPREETIESKREAVQSVIKKLVLTSCKDVKIGNALQKGISGGQAKRTNIGLALVTSPRVLFLDEPTSGLDSYTANEVMKVVRQLLTDGTTICATIHSPSQFCYSLFDRLLMLVRGQVVYFGPASDGPKWAVSLCDNVKERTAGYNDAEFLVDLVTEADRKGKGQEVASRFAESSLNQENMAQLERYLGEESNLHEDVQKQLDTKSSTMTPWWWGILILTKYRTSRNYRDPEFLGPRIGDKIFVTLVIMTLYWSVGNNYDPSNYGNIAALLFAFVILPSYGAASYVPSLVMERALFARERHDGLYHVITYLLHKMIDELVLAAISSIGIAAYTFYGVAFQGNFGLFWLIYWISLCVGIVCAYMIASASPNLDAANALLPTYVTTWLFFAGFLLKFDDMRWYWKWYSYIDPLKYSWGALVVNQFSDYDPVWGQTNRTVLETYGLQDVDQWAYLGYLSLFFLTYFLLTWFIMSVKKYQAR